MISQDEHEKLQDMATKLANQLMELGADACVIVLATTEGDGKARSFRASRGNAFSIVGLMAVEYRSILENNETEEL